MDVRGVQQCDQLKIVMENVALGEICVFQLPGSCVFWGHNMLGLVVRVTISARNGDVVFVLPKLRYHEFHQGFFRFIQKETDLQIFFVKRCPVHCFHPLAIQSESISRSPLRLLIFYTLYILLQSQCQSCLLATIQSLS